MAQGTAIFSIFIFNTIYFRAKTIKNVVQVNEELTAEEWRRRYEREREKVLRLRNQLAVAEKELERWRKGMLCGFYYFFLFLTKSFLGESVPQSEWVNLTESLMVESGTPSGTESMILEQKGTTLVPVAGAVGGPTPALAPLGVSTGVVTDEERKKYEEERASLYQQLDEKVFTCFYRLSPLVDVVLFRMTRSSSSLN